MTERKEVGRVGPWEIVRVGKSRYSIERNGKRIETASSGSAAWRTAERLNLKYENGAPMFAADGTMLDKVGNRSIFDDVDK